MYPYEINVNETTILFELIATFSSNSLNNSFYFANCFVITQKLCECSEFFFNNLSSHIGKGVRNLLHLQPLNEHAWCFQDVCADAHRTCHAHKWKFFLLQSQINIRYQQKVQIARTAGWKKRSLKSWVSTWLDSRTQINHQGPKCSRYPCRLVH